MAKAPLDAVFFDGDDTLWKAQCFYDMAKVKFSKLMVASGLAAQNASELLDEIDLQNVRSMGFRRGRFARSMKLAYVQMAEEARQPVLNKTLSEIEVLAKAAVFFRPRLSPAAEKLLVDLRGKTRLILVTVGDKGVQRAKLKSLNLSKHFDRVYILSTKTHDELRRILAREKIDPKRAIFVGNSIRSDILPAHSVGLTPIWLRCRGWAYDQAPLPKKKILQACDLRTVGRLIMKRLGQKC